MEVGEGSRVDQLGRGYYVVRFFTREDYFKALEGGPWIILGHYLMVVKWRPNFRSSRQMITSTLIWLQFCEVPLEMFDEESLSDMGDLMEKRLKWTPSQWRPTEVIMHVFVLN